jgi:hypothetical protein
LDLDPTDQGRSERGEAHLGFQLAGGVIGGEATARRWSSTVFWGFPELRKRWTGRGWSR